MPSISNAIPPTESQKQVDAGPSEIASKKDELAEGKKKLDEQRKPAAED